MIKNNFTLTLLLSVIVQASSFAGEPATDIETRIQRVENGLLAPVAIRGRENLSMTLAERMRFYKVPGLSLL